MEPSNNIWSLSYIFEETLKGYPSFSTPQGKYLVLLLSSQPWTTDPDIHKNSQNTITEIGRRLFYLPIIELILRYSTNPWSYIISLDTSKVPSKELELTIKRMSEKFNLNERKTKKIVKGSHIRLVNLKDLESTNLHYISYEEGGGMRLDIESTETFQRDRFCTQVSEHGYYIRFNCEEVMISLQ